MTVCPDHEGNEAFDLRGCTLCLKRTAGLLDRNGSSWQQDALTEIERLYVGLELSTNGHRPQPKPQRAVSLESLLADLAEREAAEFARYAGLERAT